MNRTCLVFAVVAVIVLGLAEPSFAQCAMCEAAVEGSADAAAAAQGRILSDSTRANRRSSRLHDRRRNQLKFVLDLVPGLPHRFQSGSESVHWNGMDKGGLFRDSHITHDTGDYDRASDSGHADASTPG